MFDIGANALAPDVSLRRPHSSQDVSIQDSNISSAGITAVLSVTTFPTQRSIRSKILRQPQISATCRKRH